ACQRTAIDQAEPAAAAALAAEKKVGRHAQVFREVQLLVNEADAMLQRLANVLEMHRPTIEKSLAPVRLVNTGEDLHERRFAGAVSPQNRQHLAGAHLERHGAQRLHARELLANVADFEERRHNGGHGKPYLPSIRRRFAPNSSTLSFLITWC